MSNHHIVHLPETPGAGRLGRHIEHDARSRCFASPEAVGPLFSVDWPRHCIPYDQGNLGSCTGNAMAGALMTGPLFVEGRILGEQQAVELYQAATKLDRVPGSYPPDDTGSSGLAVAKAAKRAGLLSSYHHAFTLSAALHAITHGPVIIGISWFAGFDSPEGSEAELRISGNVRGGHELCIDGIDVSAGFIKGTNSWGTGWGNQGHFVMSFGTFGVLLNGQGDVVVPLR